MSNSEWFSRLLEIDVDKLADDDRAFFETHKLGSCKQEYGFTKEEKYWISEVLENGVAV